MTDGQEADRAELLDRLGRSESRYRALVRAASQAVWVYDTSADQHASDDGVRWWENITGQPLAEAVGWGWLDKVHPHDRDRVRDQWTRCRQEGTPYEAEYRVALRDGGYRQFHVRGVPIRQADGSISEWVGIFSDVTELKRLEDQLRQAHKMEAVGQLAGGVAHDFNNVLTVIQGFSDLVLSELSSDDPIAQSVAEIKRASERAAELTRQLLAFSRRAVIRPVILDLNAVVSEAENMLRRLIGEDVDLEVSLDAMLWKVQADPVQVDQILLNLAANARDAMPKGGHLTVETRNVTLQDSRR